jgi:hypothetical protein
MHGQKFLVSFPGNTGYVFLEFFLEFGPDEVLTGFDGKDHLDVDLRVGVSPGRSMERGM